MTIGTTTLQAIDSKHESAAHPRSFWLLRRFARDESGVLVPFSLFIFLMILFVGGIGVDLMRFEMTRTRLQHTNDRAVLAAADLDQTLDPTAVVQDYFAKAGLADFLTSVVVDDGLNYRTVTARSKISMETQFMHMLGTSLLDAPAHSAAEERIANVEISLVLDISGSMASNSRLSNLRDAAGTFVDTVIRPENENLISLSIIPYSEQVNAGPLLFDRMNMAQLHNFSHCVEFDPSEFNHTRLDQDNLHQQGQHFQWNYPGYNERTDTVCPRYSYERITPLSQNGAALKAQINALQPRAGTQIFVGMKWAAAMLDPTFRPITQSLVAANAVDAVFDDRPKAWTDRETLKTIILMTDGKNSRTNRIQNWAYDAPSEYAHWDKYNLWYYLYNYVSSSQRSNFYYQKYVESQGDAMLDDICDAAKARGIVVWTIGFEVDNHGASVMNQCASSPSHFFRVEGIEITEAFRAIARQINQLRLIQ